jgi:hypothetical protein
MSERVVSLGRGVGLNGGAAARMDLTHLSDEALVALIARSDDEALAAFYDRYGRVAYGLALRILRDPALSQDAV